jgi:16S rRNA (guanine(527)-N(7))-methyltransferase RsmG
MRAHEAAFGLSLTDETIERLDDHYELVQQNNQFLHLTAPSAAEEFAVRHTLESLMLLEYLPENTRFADVGPGGGFPSLPCLIARKDLSAVLIESKEKKAVFLELAANELGLSDRVTVIDRQFEEVKEKDFSLVTCRALDKFTDKLPRLLKWGKGKSFALFGGPTLREALNKNRVKFGETLVPMSQQRYLYVSGRIRS